MPHWSRLSRISSALAALAVAVVIGACEPSTVTIGFEPRPGDSYEYRYTVTTDVTATLEGEPERRRSSRTVLDARVVIVDVSDDSVRADVIVSRQGGAPRTLQARFARGEHLTGIDLVGGVPTDTLGLEGLDELIGAAALAPPERELAPGRSWDASSDARASGITGRGRVDRLAVEDGRELAVVVTQFVTPVVTTTDGAARTSLEGTQRTRTRTAYDLVDGSVRRGTATTVGHATVLAEPPPGIVSEPVTGTIRYELRIDTRRID